MSWRITLGAAALTTILTAGCEREGPPPPEPVGEDASVAVTPSTQPDDAPAAPTQPTAENALPPGHPPATATTAPAAGAAGAGGAGPMTLSGITFEPDSAWSGGAAGGMRAAEYALPGADDAGAATLVVYYFGPNGAGPIEANLERWAGQFEVPDGGDPREAATMDEREIDGMPAWTMDLTGTYVAAMQPGSQMRMREVDWRLLGAIVETEAGPYYFKLVGPAATVSRWESAYEG
jgi:hypothetical protein